MKFQIHQDIVEKFPEVKIGVLIAKNISNTQQEASQEVAQRLRAAEREAKSKFVLETLSSHPKIQDWRKAYSAFGAKPKTYKNSIEAMLRRILKEGKVPDINNIVDIYNIISIKHLLPAGGDDLDKVDGDIQLTFAQGGEPYTLFGGKQTEPVKEGEVIYRDDKDVICRRWNWRQCDKTKMTHDTKNVWFILEGLENTTIEEMQIAIKELEEEIKKHCGGETQTFILNKEQKEVEL